MNRMQLKGIMHTLWSLALMVPPNPEALYAQDKEKTSLSSAGISIVLRQMTSVKRRVPEDITYAIYKILMVGLKH